MKSPRLNAHTTQPHSSTRGPCPLCNTEPLTLVRTYDVPLPGETVFALGTDGYQRELWTCPGCGHFITHQKATLRAFYEGEYMRATYGHDLQKHFDRIVALSPEHSDNAGRVKRVLDFIQQRGSEQKTVLDVGSGLCVFLHGMIKQGWQGTAVDPDPYACQHARERVGVTAICADFMKVGSIGTFTLVTFNKVLEHVEDPIAMLAKARDYVLREGFVYVEVPDGELAARDDLEHEEFFLGHWHVFSATSLALLLRRAGFMPLALGRLRDPSGKYTVWAFGSRA